MDGEFFEIENYKGLYAFSQLPNYVFCQGPENYQNNSLLICSRNELVMCDVGRYYIDFIPELVGMEIDHGPIADGLKVIRFTNHLSIHSKKVESLNNYQTIQRMNAISEILYANFRMEINFNAQFLDRETLKNEYDFIYSKDIHFGPIPIDKTYQWIPILYRKGAPSNGDGMIIPNWLYTTILSYQKWSIIVSLNYRGEESILTFDEKSFIDIFGVIYYTPYIISILDILNDGMDSISVRVNLKSSVLRFDNIDFILSSKDEIDPYHYRGSTFKLYEEIKAEISGRLYL